MNIQPIKYQLGIKSLYSYHPETLNIWSHVFGGLLTVYQICHNYGTNQPTVILFLYLICYTASVIYHIRLDALSLYLDNMATLCIIYVNSITACYLLDDNIFYITIMIIMSIISACNFIINKTIFYTNTSIGINACITSFVFIPGLYNGNIGIILHTYMLYLLAFCVWKFPKYINLCLDLDLGLVSHAIFHIIIVIANYSHYVCIR
jgi:hypothetical protein